MFISTTRIRYLMNWGVLLFFPIVRSIAGWLQNAAADNKFEWYEWRKLIETILKIVVPTIFLMWGTNLSEVEAGAIITIIIILLDQVKYTIRQVNEKKHPQEKQLTLKKKVKLNKKLETQLLAGVLGAVILFIIMIVVYLVLVL